MALATAIGSYPGSDSRAYDEWVRVVFGELSVPHLPELPGRGAHASMTGRALGLVAELGADQQPAGWRLTGSGGGVDQRRARSLLAQDLDALEEHAQGYSGVFKIQVAGPWTLATTVERPRGDKVLADHGARRELAQALAEGVRGHVADVRRRLPDVTQLIVQVDEPVLSSVLGARVPTASGFGRHRAVEPAEVSAALGWTFAAVVESGAHPWVHSCATDPGLALLAGAGAAGLAVDPAILGAGAWDELAEAADSGLVVALGVTPSVEPGPAPPDTALVGSVSRVLDMLGLDPESLGSRLVITPSCGLAGASYDWARRALSLTTSVARALS